MTEETKKTSKKIIRSTAYPAISLEEAVLTIESIKKKLGMGKYSRKAMSEALGYSKDVGDVARKIAALVHYGLLRREGAVYVYNSELTEKILKPENVNEKEQALIRAVCGPKLFKNLITDYEGQPLPELIENILSRKHGINENAAKKAKNIFIKSIKFAGIYNNGVITKGVGDNTELRVGEDLEDEDADIERDEQGKNNKQKNLAGFKEREGMLSLELPCGVIITYPEKLSYSFAMGEFSKYIKDLNDAISKKINSEESE